MWAWIKRMALPNAREPFLLVKVYSPGQTITTPVTLSLGFSAQAVDCTGITGFVHYFQCPGSLREITHYLR